MICLTHGDIDEAEQTQHEYDEGICPYCGDSLEDVNEVSANRKMKLLNQVSSEIESSQKEVIMFTKQHYKVISRAIKDSRESEDNPDHISAYWLIKLLCTIFHLDNPRFNSDAFRKACGEKSTDH